MSSSDWVNTSAPYLTPREEGGRDAWSEETAARGRRGRQRVVHAGEIPAPPDVAALLDTAGGQPVVVRRRIMYLDDLPWELTDTYYPAHIAVGTRLAGTARIPGGAVTLLAALGHVGALVREDVTAGMPSEEERGLLRAGPGEPALRLTRLTLDGAGVPIQVDKMTMPAGRQRLRYELRIG
ncbi:GntR family transcriptional regulator [Streptomyces sp. NBC_01803]|uniref:GntR family transcriptional regulator n=1 Tax=Streptomyces sp. NBC_01803 TaxID=2975946 RepID=UPI002DDB3439|nr:UTRA domain-containing protein [Streptomyces sp. NBC_01803]WSA46120.1 UTRA domain-containing protein [Streptomyces sp. NBC_01803]